MSRRAALAMSFVVVATVGCKQKGRVANGITVENGRCVAYRHCSDAIDTTDPGPSCDLTAPEERKIVECPIETTFRSGDDCYYPRIPTNKYGNVVGNPPPPQKVQCPAGLPAPPPKPSP